MARRPTISPAAQLETSHSPLATTHHLTSEVQTSLSHRGSGRCSLTYLPCSRLYPILPLVIHPIQNAWISTSFRMKFQLRLYVETLPQHSILLSTQLSKVLATPFTKSICFNNPIFASVPEHLCNCTLLFLGSCKSYCLELFFPSFPMPSSHCSSNIIKFFKAFFNPWRVCILSA